MAHDRAVSSTEVRLYLMLERAQCKFWRMQRCIQSTFLIHIQWNSADQWKSGSTVPEVARHFRTWLKTNVHRGNRNTGRPGTTGLSYRPLCCRLKDHPQQTRIQRYVARTDMMWSMVMMTSARHKTSCHALYWLKMPKMNLGQTGRKTVNCVQFLENKH